MNLFFKALTLNESLKILETNNYCHLSLSMNNKPYTIPINYKLVREMDKINIEVLSLKNTKKINILNYNNFVNISVEEVFESSVFSVISYGRVTRIEDYDNNIVKINIQVENITGRIISSNNYK